MKALLSLLALAVFQFATASPLDGTWQLCGTYQASRVCWGYKFRENNGAVCGVFQEFASGTFYAGRVRGYMNRNEVVLESICGIPHASIDHPCPDPESNDYWRSLDQVPQWSAVPQDEDHRFLVCGNHLIAAREGVKSCEDARSQKYLEAYVHAAQSEISIEKSDEWWLSSCTRHTE
jgi:hypothetical protein